MKKLLFVVAIAACGGGNAAHKDPMKPMAAAPTECQTIAAHVAEVVMSKNPPQLDKATVAQAIEKHCEADKWNAEAKNCFGSLTGAEKDPEPCAKTLTDEQQGNLVGDLLSRMKPPAQSAPAAPVAPASGGGPSKSNDPCEGGE